jgi:hypothetical protein
MSLSGATKILFKRIGRYSKTAQGGLYWKFEGQILLDRLKSLKAKQ